MTARGPAVFIIAVLTLSATAVAAGIPQPFSATYSGRPYSVGKLDAVITLERIGHHLRYTMRSTASAPFYRNAFYECSVMAVRGGRLYPLEYKHTDEKNPAKNLTGRFDWRTHTATVARADGKQTRLTGLTWPVWDPLSLQVGIMTERVNGKSGAEAVYRLLDRHRVGERRFRVAGEETIATASGTFKTIKVERTDGKSERFWFAKEHGYIPVRIEIKDHSVELVSNPAHAARKHAPADSTPPRC